MIITYHKHTQSQYVTNIKFDTLGMECLFTTPFCYPSLVPMFSMLQHKGAGKQGLVISHLARHNWDIFPPLRDTCTRENTCNDPYFTPSGCSDRSKPLFYFTQAVIPSHLLFFGALDIYTRHGNGHLLIDINQEQTSLHLAWYMAD